MTNETSAGGLARQNGIRLVLLFAAFGQSGGRCLRNTLSANVLQKAVFRLAKRGLLGAERWPFGARNATSWVRPQRAPCQETRQQGHKTKPVNLQARVRMPNFAADKQNQRCTDICRYCLLAWSWRCQRCHASSSTNACSAKPRRSAGVPTVMTATDAPTAVRPSCTAPPALDARSRRRCCSPQWRSPPQQRVILFTRRVKSHLSPEASGSRQDVKRRFSQGDTARPLAFAHRVRQGQGRRAPMLTARRVYALARTGRARRAA